MTKWNFLFIPLIMVCLLALVIPAGGVQAYERPPEPAGNILPGSLNSASNDNTLLQFTSGGHVLGFGSQSVYLAGLDHALRVEFNGSRPTLPVAEGADLGQNGVAPLGKVTYRDAWNNIDVIYSAVAGGITESTYVIRPGGNPSDISLRYNAPVQIMPAGSLRFDFENGYLVEKAPVAWQEIEGQRVAVAASFRLQGESQVSFDLGGYNDNYAVYIDPTYTWHTFYGSNSYDVAYAIRLDSSGNVYVAGYSGATWNGPLGVAPLHAFSGENDITIVKLNSAGAYQWHTFYGGTASDQAYGIALDTSGNIYVAGVSGAAWNGPTGQLALHAYSVNSNIVILKLSNAGAYQWHTFYNSEKAYCIALDTSGNIYVAGYSSITWNGPSGQIPLNVFGGSNDIVILKLNNAGVYQWHTFYGTTHYDEAYGIVVDSSANVYVAGRTEATWNGPSGQLPLHDVAGPGLEIFILKLNSAGAYQWHTFYGSSNRDESYCIALDSSANVYVAGYSNATWNGPAGQIPLNAFAGNYDMVILKLNSAGAYQWHTFYGSVSGNDVANAITLDSSANVYVAGYSNATWGSPWNAYTGNEDITILKLNSAGAYQRHAFFGATAYDRGQAIAPDSAGNVYVAGYSSATWNGPGALAPLHVYSSSYDLTVIKISDEVPVVPPTVTSFTTPVIPNADFSSSSPSSSASVMSYATPADVRVTTISAQPQNVVAGQAVEIFANMANRGDEKGVYKATLKINGNVEDIKSGNISGNIAVPLQYTVYRDKPGTYEVDLNGQKTFFTVAEAVKNSPFDVRIIVISILGALLLLTVVILIRRFAPRY
jgi:hypothetical protein